MSAPMLYIAGMGMVTPSGPNIAITSATIEAGIGAFNISNFRNKSGNAVTMALIPNELFDAVSAEADIDIDEGDRYNEQHERIIKMAILAARQACADKNLAAPIPTLLALTDMPRNLNGLSSFSENLSVNCQPYVSLSLTRSFNSGRAAGIETIEFAFDYLFDAAQDYLLIGGSDSYLDSSCLNRLDKEERLLAADNSDGFAPGEGAGFLLLTRHPHLALVKNGMSVALHKPGVAEEEGHLYSREPYRGQGLDQAFKRALVNCPQAKIQNIYSSMNGENHWAKELGVVQIRNSQFCSENLNIKHPADCFGDLGSATAPVLMALAAENLFNSQKLKTHIVCCSSDTAKRAAIVLETFRQESAINS
jgi:3-oxoacyl-[acyl-carrier-protein] synthase-1